MECPILLAIDTTENWERSDVALGESEIAIEIAPRPDGTTFKRLLIGDGAPANAGGLGRLRATAEQLSGLDAFVQGKVDVFAGETTGRLEKEAADRDAAIGGHDKNAGAHNGVWQAVEKETAARLEEDRRLAEMIKMLASYDGDFEALIRSVADMRRKLEPTFVIDSGEALKAWADNAPDNDYSRVLIKAGEWTLNTELGGGSDVNPLAVIDISDRRTMSVVGEPGSRIVVNNTSPFGVLTFICGIKGSVTGTYPNFINPGSDYFFKNVNIEIIAARAADGVVGFFNCANLANCTGACSHGGYAHGSGYADGFFNCISLANCTGGSGSGSGFSNCASLANCTGAGRRNVGSGSYGSGFSNCASLANCTGAGFHDSSGYGFGFSHCIRLTNCDGSGSGTGVTGGFIFCRTGFGCKGTAGSCYMEQDSGTTPWGNTAEGGWNLP